MMLSHVFMAQQGYMPLFTKLYIDDPQSNHAQSLTAWNLNLLAYFLGIWNLGAGPLVCWL